MIHEIDTLCVLRDLIYNEDNSQTQQIPELYYVKALILKKYLVEICETPKLDKYYRKIITEYLKKLRPSEDIVFFDAKNLLENKGEPLRNKKEQKYREWCLNNVLFVNHMNDITKSYLDMQDNIEFPDYVSKCYISPHYSLLIKYFNKDIGSDRIYFKQSFLNKHFKNEIENNDAIMALY